MNPMSTETQPSEHAMRALKIAREFDCEFAERNPGTLCAKWVHEKACEIDQHAIAPAVAERDRRIAELEKALKVMMAHVENYVPDIPAGGYIDHDLKLASAILAEHGGAHG